MIHSSKPKIPKGISYVLKTSMLESALEENGLDFHVKLQFRIHQWGNLIFQSFFTLPKDIIEKRVFIYAGVVPNNQRKEALELMKTKVLPSYVSWLKEFDNLPTESPIIYKRPLFAVYYLDGEVQIDRIFEK